MLLRERVRDGTGRDVAELDQELAQGPARALLLGERMLQRLGGEQALIDHELSELSAIALGGVYRAVVSRHLALIGRSAGSLKRGMLAAQARSPASVQSTKASQWTPITSVWMPSTSTAASAAAEPRRPGQQPPQQREVPRKEEEHADEAQLDPELGVRRLAGLDLRPGSLRGHAGVPEPVAPRVAKNRLDPVPEVVQVAVDRGLTGAERIAARLLLPGRRRAGSRARPG